MQVSVAKGFWYAPAGKTVRFRTVSPQNRSRGNATFQVSRPRPGIGRILALSPATLSKIGCAETAGDRRGVRLSDVTALSHSIELFLPQADFFVRRSTR